MEAHIPLTIKQYIQLAAYRVSLLVLAILVAARAAHEFRGPNSSWPLAALFAVSAAALLIWPLIVPGRNKTLVTYSLAPAFFLAAMFLLPPAGVLVVVGVPITLAGVLRGGRAYRIVFHLSTGVLAYVGPALFFHLGPRPSEYIYHPAARVGLEMMLAAMAVILHLLLRSAGLRLEQGRDSARWGAFAGPALVESVWGLVLSITILVLSRIHPAFMAIVYLELAITVWFVHRYRLYITDLMREDEPAGLDEGAFDWAGEQDELPKLSVGKVRKTR